MSLPGAKIKVSGLRFSKRGNSLKRLVLRPTIWNANDDLELFVYANEAVAVGEAVQGEDLDAGEAGFRVGGAAEPGMASARSDRGLPLASSDRRMGQPPASASGHAVIVEPRQKKAGAPFPSHEEQMIGDNSCQRRSGGEGQDSYDYTPNCCGVFREVHGQAENHHNRETYHEK